jgi:glycosyltransferase involved in cell wall biosynthesis
MSKLQTLIDTLALGRDWLGLEFGPRSAASPRQQRHLALMAWALPPNSNAGVHRPLSFLRYSEANGWRVDAFQGEAPQRQSQHGDDLIALIPPTATCHVVPDSTRQPSHSLFPRVDGGFKNALAYAQRAIRALSADPPDAVFASGPPFFVFVAAMFTARHFGVPLVLDYRDEWTECPFDFVDKSGQDLWWEQRCLKHAQAVVFVTESLRRHALKSFAELKAELTHHIPNGWEAKDFDPAAARGPRIGDAGNGTLSLAHIGNLAGHTPPHAFLRTLEALVAADPGWKDRLCVQLIGRRSPDADAAVRSFAHPEMLQVVDHVSKREASARMQAADALLIISIPELDRSLPSKLIDYIAARRPVLIFGSPGESSDLVERLGVGLLSAADDPAALGRALGALAAARLRPNDEARDQWLGDHTRDALARRLFTLLDRLVVEAAARRG